MISVKTPERMQDEMDTLAFFVVAGFFFPPLWIIAFFQWAGGAGKQV